MKTITKEYVDSQLELCMTFAAGIEKIKSSNFDHSVAQGVIATVLLTIGHDEVDSYAASIVMNMLSFITVINEPDANLLVTLSSLVNTASNIIIQGDLPEYVKEQVKVSLANKQKA